MTTTMTKTTTTVTTTTPTVISVSWTGADVLFGADTTHISWDILEAAASQSDRDLSRVYRGLLEQARDLARRGSAVRVTINNRAGAAFTYTPEMYDMAGQFVSGRIIGVEFGEQGWLPQATRAADRAVSTLRRRGYEVRVDY
jgi:hypothetical protein